MLTGQNGILNRAVDAKEKTEIASVDEQRKLAQAEALMMDISEYWQLLPGMSLRCM